MSSCRKRIWITIVLLLLLISCATSYKEIFLNRTYRENLSLEDQELKSLQFFISTSVYVQHDSPTGKKTILLPEETPGVVTSVGPDWLKVSFRKGGIDVPFIVNKRAQYDLYYVATEVPGKTGFHMLKDLPEKIFYYQGTPYRVISGEKAHLMVDSKGLQKLLKKRVPTQGRRVKTN